MESSVDAVINAPATCARRQGGNRNMGEFARAFDSFVAADPLELLEEAARRPSRRSRTTDKGSEKPTAGRNQPGMNADALARILKNSEGSVVASGNTDTALTTLAHALVRDPKDAVRALRRWGRKAAKDPHKAMGALATFAEVLKRAVALLRRVPQKFGNIIEAFTQAAAAVARAVEATSFTVTFDLPRTISLSYSWST